MTKTTTQDPQAQDSAGAEIDGVDEPLATRLVAQAHSQGISLVGPDRLLQQLTKLVLEGTLEGELTDHLGYPQGDPAGRNEPRTRAHLARRTTQGRTKREIMRCLKRYLARDIFQIIHSALGPQPAKAGWGLR
jgi:hypothetical protein